MEWKELQEVGDGWKEVQLWWSGECLLCGSYAVGGAV